jgi:RNA polymerase sigma factor (sigma-70 family)
MPEQKIKPVEPDGGVAEAFRKWAPELHRYLARRIRDPSSVPDLTQEIFERFLQLSDATEVRNTQRFLYGIASNLVKEFYDREDRSLVTFDSEMANAVGSATASPEGDEVAERLALQQDLRRALSKLPPMHRAVLLLVKREGLSYKEVADRTDLTLATVTKYVFEARAMVKLLIKRTSG